MADGVDDRGGTPAPAAALSTDPGPPERRRRLHRIPRLGTPARVLLGIALVLLLALIALWLVRKPIATRYIDRELAAKGVRAGYGLTDLGFGHQRLTDVVIGDPARPDLVADWIETRTRLGLGGPTLTGVRVGHVRIRATLVGGRVSLGAIDRLLPPPSGKPFALPALDVAVADARVRLRTRVGLVGIAVRGSGRLDDGFDGRVAVIAPDLESKGCALRRGVAVLRIRTGRTLSATGPVDAAAVACAGSGAQAVRSDVTASYDQRNQGWRVTTTVAVGSAHVADYRADGMSGTIEAAHDPQQRGLTGAVNLAAMHVRGGAVTASGVRVAGRYRYAPDAAALASDGVKVHADHAAVAPRALSGVRPLADATAGTPLAPIGAVLTRAVLAGARDFAIDATVAPDWSPGEQSVTLRDIAIRTASGATVRSDAGSTFAFYDGATRARERGLRIAGGLSIAGGGLPTARIRLDQQASGAPVDGLATIQPYRADTAALALDTVRARYVPATGDLRVRTLATLSGPVSAGRVDRLSLPIDVAVVGGIVTVGPGCAPVAFDRLAVSGLVLAPTRLTLCPTGASLVRMAGGRVEGGARVGAVRLAGRLGATPVTLAAAGAEVGLTNRGFRVSGVAARLGAPDRVTRLDFDSVSGTASGSALAARFAGGSGQIANVPLLLSGAAGDWTLRDGALRLTGALTVRDAARAPRFVPVAAEGVALSLVDGRIAATGTLVEPTTRTKVADVRIDHTLASGTGAADLRVPGITFTKTFQPTLLTPLTLGVIADVRGTVRGDGHIAWSPSEVTSTGTFGTDATDLAAAFGPVTGIAGTIRFTDLLNLQSAPGQVATIKTLNPGIAVTDGVVTYQTLPGNRVAVERGRWPFAGGTLTLEPTLLDFSQSRVRRLTFRVDGMAADKFLQQFDFKNLDATGIFDGELPMVFDETGGSIVGGHLAARACGGGIAYVGDLSQKNLGFWGNLAFGALKSLRYRNLTIRMDGPLAGEMVTEVRFAGVTQGEGAKSNFIIRRLQRLPFVFNIRIKAPFRGLLDSAQSFYDPRRLIQRNLPQLLEEQEKRTRVPAPMLTPMPVQPADSRKMP